MKHRNINSKVVLSSGILTVCLGLMVLIGWYTKTIGIIQIHPSFVPMQYNTALGFFLAGSALLLVFFKFPKAGKIISVALGLLGILTLTEYATHINIGIDELFMKHYITVNTSHSGRMAPNTALCFSLASVSILLLSSKIKRVQAGAFTGLLTFGFGLTALIGYLTGENEIYGWGNLTKMALHTSLGFVILGIGISTLHWVYEQKIRAVEKLNKNLWLLGYNVSLTFILFFIELILPSNIASGLLYVMVLLLSWYIPNKRNVTLIFAVFCTVLILLDLLFEKHSIVQWMELTNITLTIIIIWFVAILLNNLKKKELKIILTNKSLKLKSKQLERSNVNLEEMVYIASHDLQVPLIAMEGYITELLEDYSHVLDENGKHFLSRLQTNAQNMHKLVLSLLDISRVNTVQNTVEVFQLTDVVEKICEDLGLSIEKNSAMVRIDSLPELCADKNRIETVFRNLIANSLNFEATEIVIGYDNEIIYVQDNGIGVPEDQLEKMFNPGERLMLNNAEGVGMGLTFCKKVIEKHNWSIWAESEGKNRGTTVKIRPVMGV